MKMKYAEMGRLKDLVQVKADAYTERLLDFAYHCKAKSNMEMLAYKLGVIKQEDLAKQGNTRLPVEVLSPMCIEAIQKYQKDISERIKKVDHPSKFPTISEELEQMMNFYYIS